jgi:hypothetical protein
VLLEELMSVLRIGGLALVTVALVAASLAVPAARSDEERTSFVAVLSGAEEVPARETLARGQAFFQLSDDMQSMSYHLIVANIDNVIMAHIHLGPVGVNGPVVVWLYPVGGPPPAAPGGGRFDGVLVTGSFTAANLVGPLAGMSFSALLENMTAGNTYVNVHTDDGMDPPNTGPGDFPGGEVRGQIYLASDEE